MTAAEYQNPDRRLERFRGFDHLLAQRGDITNSIASGTKMWMNTSRVKKRLPSVLGCRKFRAIRLDRHHQARSRGAPAR